MQGSALRVVSERLPHVADRLARQIGVDETLAELCEDIQSCVEAAARLEPAGPDKEGLREEYAALLLRLERELLRHLEEHANGNGPSRPAAPGAHLATVGARDRAEKR